MDASSQDGRIAVSIAEASRISGLSRSKLYQLIADDKLKTTHVGRRHLVFTSSLYALLSAETA